MMTGKVQIRKEIEDIEQLTKRLMFKRRWLKAASSIEEFAKVVRPDPTRQDDPEATWYDVKPHHRLLFEILEKVERGELQRVAISVPPRHGKSEICSRIFPAWFMGKDPYRQVIIAGASGEFAESEFGRKIKAIIQSPEYGKVFPRAGLDGGSKAVGNLVFKEGGAIKSIGKGAQLVGRGADCLIIDDPYANADEAYSDNERMKLWDWFTTSAFTRLMPGGRIIIIHQRWHEDDLIGRLCDPNHPRYSKPNADQWTYINIPAIVRDQKMASALGLTLETPTEPEIIEVFGDKPMAPLWPEWYGLKFFAETCRQSPRVFKALYDGDPVPDDGDYFKQEMMVEYGPGDLPKDLRYYCASDHAVSTEQRADKTCLIACGVDDHDDIWMLPDIWWERKDTEATVDAMLGMMRQYVPMTWWAEKGHISKSIGPFLRKRMFEERVYINLVEMTPAKDKETRAQAIRGRMSMKMVHFPRWCHWWQAAKQEMLRFPNGTHDDFVDALSWLGIGLCQQIRPGTRGPKKDCIRTGTISWVMERHRHDQRLRHLELKDGF